MRVFSFQMGERQARPLGSASLAWMEPLQALEESCGTVEQVHRHPSLAEVRQVAEAAGLGPAGTVRDVPEAELTSDKYLDLIFQVLDVLAGERKGAEKRRAVRAALYEAPRRSEESYSQYILRREQQFHAAEKFMPIPNEIKAFMTEENAGLSKQGLQNLRTLTQGASDFGAVRPPWTPLRRPTSRASRTITRTPRTTPRISGRP